MTCYSVFSDSSDKAGQRIIACIAKRRLTEAAVKASKKAKRRGYYSKTKNRSEWVRRRKYFARKIGIVWSDKSNFKLSFYKSYL